MGQRSATESLAAILLAFMHQPTWRQAELAQHVGITAPALRKRLVELQEAGMPLERDQETPQVFWSVPRGWFPGGVVIAGPQVEDLLRLLALAPKCQARRRLLRALVASGSTPADTVASGELSSQEEQCLATLQDAAASRTCARIRYRSRSQAAPKWRHASVHRIVPGTPVRLVVTCHKAGELRWFRLDHVADARLDQAEPFRPAEPEAIDAFVEESVGGFHAGAEPVTVTFLVRDPEARWVVENLPEGWEGEIVPRGVRVVVRTASLGQVARYVVGLGAAAMAESPALAGAVRALALGALRASARGTVRSVEPIESSDWGLGVG